MSVQYLCGHWMSTKRRRTLERHRNPGLELVLVVNGSVTWDYGGTAVTARSRELSFTWPWQWHGAPGGSLPASEICWVLLPFEKLPKSPGDRMRLDRRLGLRPSENAAFLRSLLSLRTPVVRASRRLVREFQEVIPRITCKDYKPDFVGRAMLLGIVAELLELAQNAQPTQELPASEKVAAFLAGLAAHCHEGWTLDSMAAACGLARTQFARWVKELTGETALQCLNRHRIERAESLLTESSLGITEIALSSGFSSSQYFATVFRQFHGISPSAFRARGPEVSTGL